MKVINRALEKAKSQRNLAKVLGCSQQAVSHWCRAGKVSASYALKLADYLDISVEEVLSEG